MTISRLNNDCLQLVFEACDGCPWTLRAISQVCRQWYSISRLPSVVSLFYFCFINTHLYASFTVAKITD